MKLGTLVKAMEGGLYLVSQKFDFEKDLPMVPPCSVEDLILRTMAEAHKPELEDDAKQLEFVITALERVRANFDTALRAVYRHRYWHDGNERKTVKQAKKKHKEEVKFRKKAAKVQTPVIEAPKPEPLPEAKPMQEETTP